MIMDRRMRKFSNGNDANIELLKDQKQKSNTCHLKENFWPPLLNKVKYGMYIPFYLYRKVTQTLTIYVMKININEELNGPVIMLNFYRLKAKMASSYYFIYDEVRSELEQFSL